MLKKFLLVALLGAAAPLTPARADVRLGVGVSLPWFGPHHHHHHHPYRPVSASFYVGPSPVYGQPAYASPAPAYVGPPLAPPCAPVTPGFVQPTPARYYAAPVVVPRY
jgi:hypothetical protein